MRLLAQHGWNESPPDPDRGLTVRRLSFWVDGSWLVVADDAGGRVLRPLIPDLAQPLALEALVFDENLWSVRRYESGDERHVVGVGTSMVDRRTFENVRLGQVDEFFDLLVPASTPQMFVDAWAALPTDSVQAMRSMLTHFGIQAVPAPPPDAVVRSVTDGTRIPIADPTKPPAFEEYGYGSGGLTGLAGQPMQAEHALHVVNDGAAPDSLRLRVGGPAIADGILRIDEVGWWMQPGGRRVVTRVDGGLAECPVLDLRRAADADWLERVRGLREAFHVDLRGSFIAPGRGALELELADAGGATSRSVSLPVRSLPYELAPRRGPAREQVNHGNLYCLDHLLGDRSAVLTACLGAVSTATAMSWFAGWAVLASAAHDLPVILYCQDAPVRRLGSTEIDASEAWSSLVAGFSVERPLVASVGGGSPILPHGQRMSGNQPRSIFGVGVPEGRVGARLMVAFDTEAIGAAPAMDALVELADSLAIHGHARQISVSRCNRALWRNSPYCGAIGAEESRDEPERWIDDPASLLYVNPSLLARADEARLDGTFHRAAVGALVRLDAASGATFHDIEAALEPLLRPPRA